MRYYNYLTTPSGKTCNLYELKNKDYIILLKFLNGENFEGFYKKLNSLIVESIPNFFELDIIDKAYLYVAYFYYSIKTSINIKAEKFDAVEVPLTILLDSLEENYNKNILNYKFYKWDDCKVSYPSRIILKDNNIDIDYTSGLKEISEHKLTAEEVKFIAENAPLYDLNQLENFITHNFSQEIYVAKNIMGIKDIKDNMINPSLFYSIAYIYKDSLEHYYNLLYLVCHYIRVQWESLLEMTPVEMMILYNNFIEDKEAQNKKHSKNKTLNLNDPNVADMMMG
jgi:hypothetical protein